MPLDKTPPQVVFLPLGTPEEGVSLQAWLYESLRRAILGGRLPAGSKLPSTNLSNNKTANKFKFVFCDVFDGWWLFSRTQDPWRTPKAWAWHRLQAQFSS